MNFMMNAGMNQMKSQAMSLIPNELQDKEEDKNQQQKDGKGKDGKENQVKKKPKKKNPITKTLAIKMFSILLFHTLTITILLFIFVVDKNAGFTWLKLIFFLGGFFGGLLLSLAVSKIKCLTKFYLNYLIYIILFAANFIGFTFLSLLDSDDEEIEDGTEKKIVTKTGTTSKLVKTMFIIFDAASLTVILFSLLVKDTPSTYWLMICSAGGCIITIVIMTKIYGDGTLLKWGTMLFGAFSCAIYEAMTYNSLEVYKQNSKNEASIPSMISLPFELNACFVKIFWYVLKILKYLCTMCTSCCCPKKK